MYGKSFETIFLILIPTNLKFKTEHKLILAKPHTHTHKSNDFDSFQGQLIGLVILGLYLKSPTSIDNLDIISVT